MKAEEEYLREMFDLNTTVISGIDADPVIGPNFRRLEKEYYALLPHYGFFNLEEAKRAFVFLDKGEPDPNKEERMGLAAELRDKLTSNDKAVGPLFQWKVEKADERQIIEDRDMDDDLERD